MLRNEDWKNLEVYKKLPIHNTVVLSLFQAVSPGLCGTPTQECKVHLLHVQEAACAQADTEISSICYAQGVLTALCLTLSLSSILSPPHTQAYDPI